MSQRALDALVDLARTTSVACRDPEVREALVALADDVEQPLRVAVAGRMKAGKSTVVNALLGRSIAPTAATECTKVVAHYVYDDSEGVRVTPVDGETFSVPPTRAGGPPDDLGRPAAEIDHVTVLMTSTRRKSWTLIDTPGLDSTTAGVSTATERSVLGGPASVRAVSRVDAMLYLMPHPGEEDVNFLKEFGAVFDGTRLGAVNILGVLSKVDMLDGAGRSDPWHEARRLARRKGEELAGVVDRVVPVSGLLGQAAVAGGYREHHTAWIRMLAEQDEKVVRRALRRVDRFRDSDDLDLGAPARQELITVLGLHGIGALVAAYRQGTQSTRGLVAHLHGLSNLDELTAAVDGPLARGAILVRAATALDALDGIAYRGLAGPDGDVLDQVRGRVAQVRARPELHRMVEVQALRGFDPARSRLSPEDSRDVLTVLRDDDPRTRLGLAPATGEDDVRAAAAERARSWRAVENGSRTRRADRAIAAVLRRSYELLSTPEDRG